MNLSIGGTKEINERIIKIINYLSFIFYFLLIFEGVLRKWILPQLSNPLFFVKDPIVLAIYWLCFYYKLFPNSRLFILSLSFSATFLFLCIVQSTVLSLPMEVSIYGYRCYFFYLPLAFIIGEYFQYEDFERFARFTCYVGIPIAVLTYFQYLSPPTSYINKNVGLGEGQAFVVARGVVRPYGPFSFVSGMAAFTPSLLSMLIFNFFSERKFLSTFSFTVCLGAFFSNLAVSGSRATYGSVLVVILFLFIGSLLLIRYRVGFTVMGYLIIGFLLTIILYSTIFSTHWELITERNEIASAGEGSPVERFIGNFININELSSNVGFLGAGIGLGSMGGASMLQGAAKITLGETEWIRVLSESGVLFGSLYILLRVIFSAYILIEACKAVLKSKSSIPLVFVGFVIFNLLVGQMTMNGTNFAYGWLFFGFSMAINRYFQGMSERLPQTSN